MGKCLHQSPDRTEQCELRNYRLVRSSPCIDAGNNSANGESYDLDGNTRKRDMHCIPDTGAGSTPIIDMGPYEFQEGSVVYVDADAVGNDDGSSWSDAYNDLQDALTDARNTRSVCEIRVAEGTYEPSGGCAPSCSSGDREVPFEMVDGVQIYGGYAGYGTTEPDARDVDLYETTLSGDLDGSGTHSYTVVLADDSVGPAALLDGFTISGGRADDNLPACHVDPPDPTRYGGGFYTKNGIPVIRSCTFADNAAFCRGGGAYVLGHPQVGAPRFESCTFEGNTAAINGGGLQSVNCPIYVGDTLFINNTTTGTNDANGGAGMQVGPGTDGALIERCTFAFNTSGKLGGGFGITDYGSQGDIVNCLFYGNVADDASGGGAGGAYWGAGVMTLTGCTFAYNGCDGEDMGGAIYLDQDPMAEPQTALTNCILWENWTETSTTDPEEEADQILVAEGGGSASATYTCIQFIDTLDHITNIDTDPLYVNAGSFQFWLDATNCGDESCDSAAIDRGLGHLGQAICDDQYDVGGEADGRDRCVPLDDRDEDIDMGAYEAQSVP